MDEKTKEEIFKVYCAIDTKPDGWRDVLNSASNEALRWLMLTLYHFQVPDDVTDEDREKMCNFLATNSSGGKIGYDQRGIKAELWGGEFTIWKGDGWKAGL